MDQSGSMATSLIYGGIMGAILASIAAVETHVVAFNHEDVVDLTEHCSDPVDLLFGVQLGGAEDYWKATSYCERFMHTPAKTLYVLLADLYDTSPNTKRFVKKMEFLLESGVQGDRPAGDLRPGQAVVQRTTWPRRSRSWACRASAARPTACPTCWPPYSRGRTCSSSPTTFG